MKRRVTTLKEPDVVTKTLGVKPMALKALHAIEAADFGGDLSDRRKVKRGSKVRLLDALNRIQGHMAWAKMRSFVEVLLSSFEHALPAFRVVFRCKMACISTQTLARCVPAGALLPLRCFRSRFRY